MSKKHQHVTRAESRRREQLRRQARNDRILKSVLGVIVAAAVIAVIALLLSRGGSGGPEPSQDISPTGSAVKIPIGDLSAQAKFFTSTVSGTKVRFFAIRDGDGSVHVATDACDVCYAQKKGYHQEGSDMVCNNCGKHFGVQLIGTANTQGGCWPSFLKMHTDGGDVVVENQDIAAKAFMFQ